MKRRLFIAGTISSALAGCAPIGTALNGNTGVHRLLGIVQPLNHALISRRGLAQTYPESAISADFPVESLPTPSGAEYAGFLSTHFRFVPPYRGWSYRGAAIVFTGAPADDAADK